MINYSYWGKKSKCFELPFQTENKHSGETVYNIKKQYISSSHSKKELKSAF